LKATDEIDTGCWILDKNEKRYSILDKVYQASSIQYRQFDPASPFVFIQYRYSKSDWP